jgi:hypothetical protein
MSEPDDNSHNGLMNEDEYLSIKEQAALRVAIFLDTKTKNVLYTGKVKRFSEVLPCKATKTTVGLESDTDALMRTIRYTKGCKATGVKCALLVNICQTRGGSVRGGGVGVEEDLCRRTNYWCALKALESTGYYTSKCNDVVMCSDVVPFKFVDGYPHDPKTKRIPVKDRVPITVLGTRFPTNPDVIYIGDKATYANESDRQAVRDGFRKMFGVCAAKGIRMVVIDRACMAPATHPIEELTEIMKSALLASNLAVAVIVGNSGNIDGDGKIDRARWIHMCRELDNKNDFSKRGDVQEPLSEEIDEINRRRDSINSVESGLE